MPLPATRFRASLYKVLNQVIDTGVPVEIELRGRRVKIVPADPESKLKNLVPHPNFISGKSDDLARPSFDLAAWEKKWRRLGSL